MNSRNCVPAIWLLAAALFVSLLPRRVYAQETWSYEQLTEETALVSGQYVLLSSGGYAPGCLDNGWLIPEQPTFEGDVLTAAEGAVWTLEVTQDGILLMDPAGIPVSPGESDETGLISGEYRWRIAFSDGLVSFHGTAGEKDVTLARCDDLGFRAYDDRLIGALYDGGFTLYRLTESEAEPEDPTEGPTDPTEGPTDPTEEPTGPSEESTDPAEGSTSPAGPGLFFGLLHSHTADSDGTGTPAEAYGYARDVAGLDFLAITDHSNSFDGAENGVLSEDASAVSEIWRLGKEAARSATKGDFLALYGFEMTWQNGLGHISTLFTPGFQSRNQAAYETYGTALDSYFQTLATVPGSVSQFNHPGTFYGEFDNFGHYSPGADGAMQLLEVVCEGVADYNAYTRALDLGWHVAPTSNQNNHNGQWGTADTGRTVVYAESLTEAGFASALAGRRVYATEDSDLHILYRLDGYLFGTMLHRRDVGDTVILTAAISDATDGTAGTVEVIVDGGAVAASAEAGSEVRFELPSAYNYYYLRITQPDGDIAVTAPVWIEQREAMQITSFTTDTLLAVQDKPFALRVEVENRDAAPLTVEQVTFSIGGQTIGFVPEPEAIPGKSTAVYTAQLTCSAAGPADIRVDVTGNIGGAAAADSSQLSLTFLTEDLVTTIVADGSHGNLPALTKLEKIAAGHRMVLNQSDVLTAEILSSCDVLLIPAPEREFEENYVNLIRDYLLSGRTLILCGAGDASAPEASARLNVLAEALGLTARFRDDTAFDPVNNGGRVDELYTTVYNDDIDSSRPYCQTGGCTVDSGMGTWLVRGMASTFSIDGDGDGEGALEETCTEVVDGFDVVHALVTRPGEAVLLAREQSFFGGTVYLSGGLFLGDDAMEPGGTNLWDEPNGNAQILEAILNIRRQTADVVSAADAQSAKEGETIRIRGWVTVGTAAEWNSFPGMIYMQDDTAGLGIPGFTEPGVSIGTPLELYLLRTEGTFRLLHWEVTEETPRNIQPVVLSCGDAANYDLCPEMLVQAEGRVVSRTLTEDGLGVSSFTLEDREGNRVTVSIESRIKSASTGENTLADIVSEDNWVSAIGIQYRSGDRTVLRVRNCDEVVQVREKEKVYRVVQGAYTVWIPGEGKSVYMEVEGPAEEFLGIDVDGIRIDQGHYRTTEEGNLHFRFWPRYLRTLEPGLHEVVFRFRDGQAKADLLVWNPGDNPQTGDPILLSIGSMLFSGALLLRKRRRIS